MSEVRKGSVIVSEVEAAVQYVGAIINPSIEARGAHIEGVKFLASLRQMDDLEFNNLEGAEAPTENTEFTPIELDENQEPVKEAPVQEKLENVSILKEVVTPETTTTRTVEKVVTPAPKPTPTTTQNKVQDKPVITKAVKEEK